MSRLISRKATLYAQWGFALSIIIPYFTRMPGYSLCVL